VTHWLDDAEVPLTEVPRIGRGNAQTGTIHELTAQRRRALSEAIIRASLSRLCRKGRVTLGGATGKMRTAVVLTHWRRLQSRILSALGHLPTRFPDVNEKTRRANGQEVKEPDSAKGRRHRPRSGGGTWRIQREGHNVST
jgi:hypothetical protein